MSKMIAIANLLMVGVLAMVAGQAPGDEQELCTVSLPALGRNIVEDPPNGRILMDSSHYNRLLPPNSNPVWQAVDLDDNNPTGLQSSVSIIRFLSHALSPLYRSITCILSLFFPHYSLLTNHIKV